MSRRAAGGAALLAVVVAHIVASPARAAVVPDLSIEDLARASDVVVVGRVVDRRAAWDDRRATVLTTTTVLVAAYLAGSGGDRIAVRQVGGTAGGVTIAVPGNARLDPGEDVVLFLRRDGATHFVVAMALGAFHVTTNAVTGARTATRDLADISVAGPRTGGRPVAAADATPLRLDALAARVQRALAR